MAVRVFFCTVERLWRRWLCLRGFFDLLGECPGCDRGVFDDLAEDGGGLLAECDFEPYSSSVHRENEPPIYIYFREDLLVKRQLFVVSSSGHFGTNRQGRTRPDELLIRADSC